MMHNSFHDNALAVQVRGRIRPDMVVPMAAEVDFETGSARAAIDLYDLLDRDNCAYLNVETCPDCSAGMIRTGRCAVCPSCGFESCMV